MKMDNCYCCNCCHKVLVPTFSEECPLCHAVGCLSWIENEPEEINICDVPDVEINNSQQELAENSVV